MSVRCANSMVFPRHSCRTEPRRIRSVCRYADRWWCMWMHRRHSIPSAFCTNRLRRHPIDVRRCKIPQRICRWWSVHTAETWKKKTRANCKWRTEYSYVEQEQQQQLQQQRPNGRRRREFNYVRSMWQWREHGRKMAWIDSVHVDIFCKSHTDTDCAARTGAIGLQSDALHSKRASQMACWFAMNSHITILAISYRKYNRNNIFILCAIFFFCCAASFVRLFIRSTCCHARYSIGKRAIRDAVIIFLSLSPARPRHWYIDCCLLLWAIIACSRCRHTSALRRHQYNIHISISRSSSCTLALQPLTSAPQCSRSLAAYAVLSIQHTRSASWLLLLCFKCVFLCLPPTRASCWSARLMWHWIIPQHPRTIDWRAPHSNPVRCWSHSANTRNNIFMIYIQL